MGLGLMDRPTKYRGGRESVFRRSESASFFGREIGLQYVHAHLRYAEALAAMGHSEELLHALSVVNPIAATDVVKNARCHDSEIAISAARTRRSRIDMRHPETTTSSVPVKCLSTADGGYIPADRGFIRIW